MNKITLSSFVLICLFSCNFKGNTQHDTGTATSPKTPATNLLIAEFDKDSAFSFLQKQCQFGPRVPNTAPHKKCGEYLANELRRFGAEVIIQEADLKAYNGEILKAKNIIGVFYPEKEKRIALFAHWDSRPFCDNDPNPANLLTPVMGANDGASGVAVLLEVARQLQTKEPAVGVDIVFFDAEDYGEPSFAPPSNMRDTWCLGSQYWGKNPHYKIKPQYGILLDMVGGVNPTFRMDVVSLRMAPHVLEKVWSMARKLGYGEFFQEKQGGSIIDDHLYVNTLTGIPTIDIIDHDDRRGFPETWHTINDTPENINKQTLEMVGRTVVTVLYNE